LLVSQRGSPETREIAQRMLTIAEEEGLDRADDTAVDYLQAALHAHLTRLVKAAPPTRKREREETEEELTTKVSLRIAADKDGPQLLCDDLPVHRERLLLL
jgi:hypothetical protein